MESLILDGKIVRDSVFADLSERTRETGRRPGLAVILVGDDPASRVYVSSKGKACEKVGFQHETHELPGDVPESDVLDLIDRLNGDPRIHGILVQIPLPAHLSETRVQRAILLGGGLVPGAVVLMAGEPGLLPCTPRGIIRICDHYGISLPGREVVVVGRSVIVGRTLAMLMSLKTDSANATVTICHSGTRDLAAVVRRADVVVAAMGAPAALGRDHIREGAVVIDVGINRVSDSTRKKGYRIVGDVDPDALGGWASAYTPVPGGVGPMTIAMLLDNTWDAMTTLEGG